MANGDGKSCPMPGGGQCPTVDRLDGDVQSLRRCIEQGMGDLTQQSRALGELAGKLEPLLEKLVQMRIDQSRDQGALRRIGEQVDDHERRLRALEQLQGTVQQLAIHVDRLVEAYPDVKTSSAVNASRLSHTERIIWIGLLFASGLLGAFLNP